MTDLLRIEDLHVTFATDAGPAPAVKGVSLSVAPGEVLALVGESGSGKTVTARSVLGLLPATATARGRVLLGDGTADPAEDVLAASPARLRALRGTHAAMVFQEPSTALNPVFTIGWQLTEGLRAHGHGGTKAQRRALAVEWLDKVGIPDPATRVNHYPHQLSGGQKQRVMIAMALACDPQLVVADEPTTALDVMVQAQVLDVLSDLVHERQVGMLMISHDLSVLAELCDRITVMYAGRVVEEGPASQVFTDPLHPYTGALSAAFPRVGDPAARFAPAGLPGDPPDPRNLTQGCSFAPRCPRAAEVCLPAEPALRSYAEGRAAACVRIGHQDEAAS
jgi:peptide/nickel transport system ATP-binding protein